MKEYLSKDYCVQSISDINTLCEIPEGAECLTKCGLEFVFWKDGGKYLDRPETPVFIGGMTQYIEFDEVISKSAAETAYGNQPLGDIAAIGRGGKPVNNGHIHYQCEEPGYIMGLMAITPIIDYSQGNDFDLNLQTIDDLHKPALDGIGYQDLIQEQMVGVTSKYDGGPAIDKIKHLAANKTVAWVDYMTNYNRTSGDFAAGEA